MLHVLLVEAELAGREGGGQFCWDQHCQKGFVQRMLEGCF